MDGCEIKKLRKKMGLSRGRFAQMFKVDPQTVYSWENGLKQCGRTNFFLLRCLSQQINSMGCGGLPENFDPYKHEFTWNLNVMQGGGV